ncbi:MAG: FMN-binding protein [Puniceicoccaceae bacterium]
MRRRPSIRFFIGLCLAAGGLNPLAAAEQVYLEPEAFIAGAFEGEPEQKVLWLNRELKTSLEDILGHPYKGLRIRYWRKGERTAWILEEIGKVELITTGFVVENGVMQSMEVLIYRESHGWEVRFPFFTNQFKGRVLKDGKLDKKIDGISGATLSVNALTRLSRMALFLHGEAVQ